MMIEKLTPRQRVEYAQIQQQLGIESWSELMRRWHTKRIPGCMKCQHPDYGPVVTNAVWDCISVTEDTSILCQSCMEERLCRAICEGDLGKMHGDPILWNVMRDFAIKTRGYAILKATTGRWCAVFPSYNELMLYSFSNSAMFKHMRIVNYGQFENAYELPKNVELWRYL